MTYRYAETAGLLTSFPPVQSLTVVPIEYIETEEGVHARDLLMGLRSVATPGTRAWRTSTEAMTPMAIYRGLARTTLKGRGVRRS
ncbi:hypothetical protein [Streptomyces sp. NPDC005799]|uniref:hypothetical protein n=1 Tax=Streptomyces sp. NPDC005799 TaxID=3154678 RepID=UPI0033E80C80